MGNRLSAILVGLAVVLFLGYSSIFVVNERQQAIVVRFGEIQDVKTAPGLYFKLPFAFMDADRVQYIENRALRFDHDNIRVQVSGGKFYEVDAFVVYRITDARRFRQTVSVTRCRRNRACVPVSTHRCAGSTVCAASDRRFRMHVHR